MTDTVGQPIKTWKNEATVWAEIRPLTAREQFIAAQRQASTTHLVSIRYNPDLAVANATWRITFGVRIFSIDGPPKNVDERNIELQLECTEGLKTD